MSYRRMDDAVLFQVNLAHENEPDAKVGVLFVDEEESRQENPDAILVLPYRQ